MPQARPTIHEENDRVRLTTWTFDDGDATGHHTHEFDYVVVPITGGRFEIIEDDGSTRELVQDAAVPYLGRIGTSHDVVNRSGFEARFIEIELKGT
jgi:quercetin dioxygenase-like cupin family protein